MSIRKYFRRPRVSRDFVFFTGGMVILVLLFPVAVLSLGSFQLSAVVDDWYAFCDARFGE